MFGWSPQLPLVLAREGARGTSSSNLIIVKYDRFVAQERQESLTCLTSTVFVNNLSLKNVEINIGNIKYFASEDLSISSIILDNEHFIFSSLQTINLRSGWWVPWLPSAVQGGSCTVWGSGGPVQVNHRQVSSVQACLSNLRTNHLLNNLAGRLWIFMRFRIVFSWPHFLIFELWIDF